MSSASDSGRRITVLRVIDRLNVGGPAIHAVLTSKGLDPARFRTVLVMGSVEPGEADMGYLLEGTGIECVVIPSLGRELRPLRDIRTAWQLWRLMRRERPDVVHTHKAKAGAVGRVVAMAAGVPVRVHTFHGHVLRGYFGPLKSQFFLQVERLLGRVSSRLVALSTALVDELSQGYGVAPRDKFAIVPLGFDLAPFATSDRHRGELRARLGVAPATRLVAIVGRMVPIKDHMTFVAAGARVAAANPDVHLVFVGGGELEHEVKRAVAERGLAERAHFLGWTKDMHRIYPDIDVVALSSQNEGTPVALIEAMACGVPVASTAVGGVPDLLAGGSRGELVPPGNPDALAQAIERALSPVGATRAARVRDEILTEFSERRLCRDLERLYLELLGENALSVEPRTPSESPRDPSVEEGRSRIA